MSKVIDLTDDSFDKVINSTDKPVIVDFYATWCGHCRSQAIILEKFANEFAGDVVVASVDVDENRQKANQYFISGIPAIDTISPAFAVETSFLPSPSNS